MDLTFLTIPVYEITAIIKIRLEHDMDSFSNLHLLKFIAVLTKN